jgi:hypothetical protein
MKISVLLPWICVLGLAVGLAAVHSNSRQQAVELAQLRKDSEELQTLRAADAGSNAQPRAEGEELARLRKDHEDLLRLRNEIRQLRDEKTQLSKQLQTAESRREAAPVQPPPTLPAPATGAVPPGLPPGLTPGSPEAIAFAKRYGLQPAPPLNTEQEKAAACLNNLKQIEGAKQQWALEKSRPTGGLVGPTDISPYLVGNAVPTCPSGGTYTLNPIGISPICNIPGHSLTK